MLNGQKYITVFADASYCSRTRVCGWAFWIKADTVEGTVRRSGVMNNVVNSTDAEILAMVEAIKFVETIDYQDCVINVQSDCMSALDSLRESSKSSFPGSKALVFKHVKGHQGVKGPRSAVNTWCDRTAKMRMRSMRDVLDIASRAGVAAQISDAMLVTQDDSEK